MSNWWPTYIAEHEAAHAVVAQKMGLRVAWVRINPDPTVDFFHMAATGIEIEGEDEADNMKLASEVEIEDRDTLLGVTASMSAPSHLHSHKDVVPGLYRYAQLEADAAYEMAGRGGIPVDEVWDAVEVALGDGWQEMCDLADRLVREGSVEFDTTSA
jgi:hypothetical protein